MTAATDGDLLPTTGLGARRALWRLSPVLGRHRRGVALTVAAALGNQASGIAAAAVAASVTGQVAIGAEVEEITPWLVALAALAVTKAGFAWAESWVAHDMAYRVMADLRVEVFDGLSRLAPAWLLGKRTGDVASAALADVEALEWFYAHTVAQVAVTVATPAGAVVVLALIDPWLALALAPFALLVAGVPLVLLRRGRREGQALRHDLARLQAETTDVLQGVREIVLLGDGPRRLSRLAAVTRDLGRVQRAQASRTGAENGASEALLAGAMVAVLITGLLLVDSGDLERARYPLAVVVAGLALAPILVITGGVRNLGLLGATASRVVAVIDTPARVTDPVPATSGGGADGAGAAPLGARGSRPVADSHPGGVPSAPSVRFAEVRFGYEPGRPVLDGVTFDVPGGSTMALVGVSGVGKSTCANLLLRFWDPDDGRILLDGTDLRDLPLARLRRIVSLVPQDPYLFRGTIADNLRLARPDALPSELERAARAALVTEFTDDLPDGLDTMIGERGSTLSGGQRQRVALAQALLRDAQVLVLDEAVAGIDTQGEALVQDAIARARSGRTTIVIAHRLSTIVAADRVVVLDGGRVVEEGRPGDLLDGDGPFRRLVARQLDGIV